VTDVVDRVSDVGGLPVELVSWPRESARRDALARAGVPRMLLVDSDAMPPAVLGVDEDWVRLPAAPGELTSRAAHLLRATSHLRTDSPFVDTERVLHRAGATVPLTAMEATITVLLLQHPGEVVDHAMLEREIWHGEAPSRAAIDAAIYRLRRRLAGLSMCIRSIRGRGFVLDLQGGR
jgi:DNA-binding response OmpR family regulator